MPSSPSSPSPGQPLRFRSLASGSAANATLVQGCDGQGAPMTVLIDCGLTQRQLAARLQGDGLQLRDIQAIFVTHEHSDHVGPSFELARSLGIPIWSSYGTWQGAGCPDAGGLWRVACDGQPIAWGAMQATPFTVPHDAREPLQLCIRQGQARLALLTDLGHVTPHALAHAAHCQALLLEFNHEPELLQQSRYPPFLKRRIAGPRGHLSNAAAAQLLAQVLHAGLRHVVAGHLSQQNNCPQRTLQWMRQAVGEHPVALHIATQEQGCDWIELDAGGAQQEAAASIHAEPAGVQA
ncbi:MBL fold metallo-hydrolase [Vandammella animalimorsus]|uniref:MBL fold metallo-hydrolase n=1 Tax=Vandammella animalimorsus TaxID=2029117 RepID=UPI0031BBC0D8